MTWGLDGARGGWILARLNPESESGAEVYFCSDLQQVLEKTVADSVNVDMPIGLGTAEHPERDWDVNARKILSGRLSSRVFTPPIRELLECATYTEANAMSRELIGKGLSVQSWNLVPKIKALDSFLEKRRALRGLWLETHPEIAFAQLNDGQPIVDSKKTDIGAAHRASLLCEQTGVQFKLLWEGLTADPVRGRFLKDDVLDALALATVSR